MKKFLVLVLVAIVSFFSFVSPVLAGGEIVDPLRAAQVFGDMEICPCFGNFSFDRFVNAVNTGWVSATFRMTGDGKITHLSIDDSVIVGDGDQPLEGLPVNAVGETRNFYLYLTTQHGKAFGNFQKDLLLPGEAIEVILKPGWVHVVIPFAGKGSTLPENAVLKTEDGSSSNYSPFAGGFTVWVDPLKTTAYTIVDTVSGLVVTSGVIDPLQGTKTDTSSIVNVRLAGGVVILPNEFGYILDQKFDSQLADGTPAKVYVWSPNGQAGNVNVWSGTGTGTVHISVLRWMPTGEMTVISTSDDYGNAHFGDGYDKVVVVVTGTVDTFDINFSTGTGAGGGGGKG